MPGTRVQEQRSTCALPATSVDKVLMVASLTSFNRCSTPISSTSVCLTEVGKCWNTR